MSCHRCSTSSPRRFGTSSSLHPRKMGMTRSKQSWFGGRCRRSRRGSSSLLTAEDRKPSQLLRRMQQLLGTINLDDNIFKQLLLQRLPNNIQLILASTRNAMNINLAKSWRPTLTSCMPNSTPSSVTSYRVPIYTPGSRAAMWINCLAEGTKVNGDGEIRTRALSVRVEWILQYTTTPPYRGWWYFKCVFSKTVTNNGSYPKNRYNMSNSIHCFSIKFCLDFF